MPIESAPKSARAVLIYCPDRKNIFTAENGSGAWRSFGGFSQINEAPSHWQPLPANPDEKSPKPLAGVGIVVQSEGKVLGIVFAPGADKLKHLLTALHGSALTVNLADIRGGTITLQHPPK